MKKERIAVEKLVEEFVAKRLQTLTINIRANYEGATSEVVSTWSSSLSSLSSSSGE